MLPVKFMYTAMKGTSKVPMLLHCFPNLVKIRSLQTGSKTAKMLLFNPGRQWVNQYQHVCMARTSVYQVGPPVCAIDNRDRSNLTQYRTFTEDRKTTALTLIKDLKHIRTSPIPALVLGVAGVIPFAAAPAYLIFSGHFMSSIAFCQVAYGACILSFLGGVRWGLSVSTDETVRPDWFNLGYSVTPSLVAWVGLLLPTSASILVLISGLLGSCFMDVTLWGYPPWFKALRFLLTFLAVLSLWTTLMCRLLMKSEEKEEKVSMKTEMVQEKSSWFKLPWKSSKPTPSPKPTSSPELPKQVTPSKAVGETPEKLEELEEPVSIEPMPLPELPTEYDVRGNTEKTEDSDDTSVADESDKEKVPKKELRW